MLLFRFIFLKDTGSKLQHTTKELLSQEEVLHRHRELSAQFGNQADKVVAQAQQHEQSKMHDHCCPV